MRRSENDEEFLNQWVVEIQSSEESKYLIARKDYVGEKNNRRRNIPCKQ